MTDQTQDYKNGYSDGRDSLHDDFVALTRERDEWKRACEEACESIMRLIEDTEVMGVVPKHDPEFYYNEARAELDKEVKNNAAI